jgi:hypothetical protein
LGIDDDWNGGFILNKEQDATVSERNPEKERAEPNQILLHREPDIPLFLRDSSDGQKGNAQDEKDRTEE